MPSLGDAVECIRLETVHEPGFSPPPTTHSFVFDRTAYASIADMLSAFQSALQAMDPDVLLTAGGDQRWFPWLVEQSEVHGRSLALGRTAESLQQSTHQRTIHSYGQTRHRHGSFFLNGRLHLDLKNSFIVNEGGLAGLFELAQHSVSQRKSSPVFRPVRSSAPSRCAWPRRRGSGAVEEKQARGHKIRPRPPPGRPRGLYLDSRPGVHASVIELDFASLFPSIIATRNISLRR